MNVLAFSRAITPLITEYMNSGSYATLYISVAPTGFKREGGQHWYNSLREFILFYTQHHNKILQKEKAFASKVEHSIKLSFRDSSLLQVFFLSI